VRTDQTGSLILSNSPVGASTYRSRTSSDTPEKGGSGALTFTQPDGSTRRLYVLAASSQENPVEFALPPTPPDGSFDVRFSSTQSNGIVIDPQRHTNRFPIELSTRSPIVTLRWDIADPTLSLELVTDDGAKSSQYLLRGKGTTTIPTDGGVVHGVVITRRRELQADALPQAVRLAQNFPNPFNPSTTIEYALPFHAFVHLAIYDVLGRKVQDLVGEQQEAGAHYTKWDATGASSGVYYYRFDVVDLDKPALGYHETKKMFLAR